MAKQQLLSPQDIENIVNNTSIVEYFHYLAQKGHLKFDRQRGHDYYFLSNNEKYSLEKVITTLKRGKADKLLKQ